MNRVGRISTGLGLAATAALALSGCSSGASNESNTGKASVRLSLVAYSTPQAAYEKIIKAFQQTPAGKNVTFTQSYGASGDQSRAVESGLPADVVAFSLQPDMQRLVDDGMVASDWNAGPHGGMVTDSVVAIVVRKGNPKAIQTWADLTKPGTQVITAK